MEIILLSFFRPRYLRDGQSVIRGVSKFSDTIETALRNHKGSERKPAGAGDQGLLLIPK